MEERLDFMPVYGTKALLVSIAEIALRDGAKSVYKAVAKMANVEGVALATYEDARAELEADKQ